MSTILDLLQGRPSAQERLLQLLSLTSQGTPTGGGSGNSASYSSDPNSGSDVAPFQQGGYQNGTITPPSGEGTQFPYRVYDKPYFGVPDNLVTKFGVTLQPGPMHSLLDIARGIDLAPGAREVGWIDQGYRSPEAQAAAYAAKPGIAAPPGQSYHGQGLAIDAARWSEIQRLARALANAGWNQFSPGGEPWHWSYGVTG